MYPLLFCTVLSRMDPEDAHHLASTAIALLPPSGLGWLAGRLTAPDPSLAVDALGLRFPSPFGVAAGFDKDAQAVLGLGQLGFGHVEVGTVTADAQPGNPRPRLFRLIEDRAVVNRMGFNNGGAAALADRLRRLRARRDRPVIGVNIGKTRAVAVEDAVADYVRTTRLVAPVADYLAVNVSSPNTPGLRGLQEIELLRPLLTSIRDAAGGVPVLVKIAPDLQDAEVERIAELATELGLAGVIATNTTLSRRDSVVFVPLRPALGRARRRGRGCGRPLGRAPRRALARGAGDPAPHAARGRVRHLRRRGGHGRGRPGAARRGRDARAGVHGVPLPGTGVGPVGQRRAPAHPTRPLKRRAPV
jgi:dihydroorotate dehydrogenase